MSSPSTVIVHPLVLLSAVDHYTRIYGLPIISSFEEEKQKYPQVQRKRAVGILLGSYSTLRDSKIMINVASSYAEDEKTSEIWFLDHSYHEAMHELCRKVNAKERVVGWYHTGPSLCASDIRIHNSIISKYTSNPILVIIDVAPKTDAIPVKAYSTYADPTTFAHVSCTIAAEEAEEIGVGHLLRDVSVGSTTTTSSKKISSLKDAPPSLTILSSIESELVPLTIRHNRCVESLCALIDNLKIVVKYLSNVSSSMDVAKSFALDPKINNLLQDIIHLLPSQKQDLSQELIQLSNDRAAMSYVATIANTIISLHNLVSNKMSNKAAAANQ